MKIPALLVACLLFYTLTWAQTGEICITFDDLPTVSYDYKEISFQQSIVEQLIATFDTYGIPAIGFVNENKLYVNGALDSQRVDLLKTWLEAGYEIGNHTFSHKDYHKVSYEEFTADIIDGEKVSKPLTKKYDLEYIYFRHPYLHVGLNKDRHDSLRTFLQEHDYIEAPVSIDNDDYIFAYAYSKAMLREDEELMKKIGRDYVDYMEAKLVYFEGQSNKLLGRNIRHILLLHANAINADYLDELILRYKSHGYKFISMGAALMDEAYQTEISMYNNWGISWIDRWALSAGKKSEFFKGDPATPDYVKAFLKQR